MEADYLLFPLNRQRLCRHWVVAALGLCTKQLTLLDSRARKDSGATLAKAEIETPRGYLGHLSEHRHAEPVNWADNLFPAEQSPQRYTLSGKARK